MHTTKRQHLFQFLEESYTPYHAAHLLAKMVADKGFTTFEGELSGSCYKSSGGVLWAFRPGTKPLWESGVRILMAHLDSPCFGVKQQPDQFDGLARLSLERYGGMNMDSFKDIPLRLAGRVFSGSAADPQEKLFVSKQQAVIPSLAVHLKKEDQKDSLQENLQALWSLKDMSIQDRLLEELSLDQKEILTWETYLVPAEGCTLLDEESGLFMAPRLDDLSQAYVAIEALLESEPAEAGQLVLLVNHEEIGSMSSEGAFSPKLSALLEQLVLSQDGERKEYYQTIEKSNMVSLDLAHGYHPNYAARYDKKNAPLLGQGPAVKVSTQGKYATDTPQRARLMGLAKEAGLSVQTYQNHSDIKGGTTIGPLSSAMTGIPAVDIGVPILGMHASREVACLGDFDECIRWMKAYYQF
jgi:aspartyl aminopeptidase